MGGTADAGADDGEAAGLTRQSSVREVGAVFLRLGASTFGGPLAHIAAMEDEIVRRRGWLTRDAFLDLAGITALLPGPNSTELAMAIGMRRAGWGGLVVAGVAFILPAMVCVWALAALYVAGGSRSDGSSAFPLLHAALSGVQPVVLAVVAQAVWRLGRTAIRAPWMVAMVVAIAVLAAVGAHELALLAAGALASVAVARRSAGRAAIAGLMTGVLPASPAPSGVPGTPTDTTLVMGATAAATAGATAAAVVSLPGLAAVFLKIGATLFGSGYVLFAFLRREFVERRGVLPESQLLDAIAIGQATPGPLFTAATFVGYLLHGGAGAVVATVAIFAPAFALTAVHEPVTRAVSRSPALRAALDGVNVASLAVMATALVLSARAALVTPLDLLIAVTAAAVLLATRVSAAMLLVGGAIVGVARFHLGVP